MNRIRMFAEIKLSESASMYNCWTWVRIESDADPKQCYKQYSTVHEFMSSKTAR
jgi:hypothetical protein